MLFPSLYLFFGRDKGFLLMRKADGGGGWRNQVLVSKYNSLGGGRYFDPEAGVSWAFDYVTGVS